MISYEKIIVFYELKKKVHVSCDGRFYNGKILEVNNEKKFLLLLDNKIGEVPIMFDEILNIEPYQKKEVEDNGKI